MNLILPLQQCIICTTNYTVSCPRRPKCLYPHPWKPYASLKFIHRFNVRIDCFQDLSNVLRFWICW